MGDALNHHRIGADDVAIIDITEHVLHSRCDDVRDFAPRFYAVGSVHESVDERSEGDTQIQKLAPLIYLEAVRARGLTGALIEALAAFWRAWGLTASPSPTSSALSRESSSDSESTS